MKLTPQQLKQFDDDGYLFFPSYFSREETAILKSEIPGVFAQRREENVREKTGDVVRTAFAVHTYHPVFEALVHSPRFVEPAEQLLKDKTYIHQFKINGKAAFDGDVWQWHQDYGTWKADDDMPEAALCHWIEKPDLGIGEGDGNIGDDGVSGDRAGVGIHATGDVDCDDNRPFVS